MLMRLCFALVVTSGAAVALAQDQTPPAAAAQGEAQTRFEQVYENWKGKLKEIRTVQVKYQDASREEKAALHAQFEQLVSEARAMVPELMQAAEAAYAAAPNEDETLARFMSQIVADHAGSDNYEEALRLSRMLIENKTANPRLYLIAGVAAFATNQFDLAEKYLTLAQEQGLLEPPGEEAPEFQKRMIQSGQMYLSLLEPYREMWAKEQKIRQAEAQADDLPRVKLETSQGEIVVELFENEAPIATANFITLVEQGYYDGLKFHRVLPGFMAQGGCPQGTGTGGPGYSIPCELHPNHRKHFRGTLSMAHAGRNTGGSQFFLTFVPTPHLDGQHTAFGRVIDGIEVLSKLQRIEPGTPGDADKIVKATVLRKRDRDYSNFEKLPARR